MMKWMIGNRIAAFERTYSYDMSYARMVLQTDTAAMLALAKITAMSTYRKAVPREVYYAAKLVSTLAEDCGPCAQLMITMALRDGVAPAMLASVVESLRTGDLHAVTPDVALGITFAQAVLAHAPPADELREQILAKWGPRAVVSLAFAITAAGVYPTLKYALGFGHACQRLDIAGTKLAPPPHAAALGAHSLATVAAPP